ncbi:metalloendopeptidase OMA1, mitochondrial isoform X4 [Stegostoma tigrinum]|uniref:metalloendopeptidase OMA1, mitochondrial isoform X4 n=1 Tax=Stegostoma tigrinum TaxID=3053191 RepID=UPI00202B59CC|nr:metalloendopeptidase OMA1, mitochondrial isoform X4 [Stegostoma tigrinum]
MITSHDRLRQSAEMKTGLWFWNARRHLFSWQNCTSLQKISGLPEKTQAWKTCKIKIQRLTSSNNHNYSRSDSPVWQTYVQCKGELIPCTRHYSVLRTIVHSVGHASKRGPAIQVSMVISRTFSYYSRYMPACVLSTKLSILEDAADLSRDFHTSSRDLALPIPLLWILLKPVKKLTAMLLGRSIRKWWQALPPEKQDLLKDYVKRNKWRILFGVCSLSCLIAIYFWTHLDKNPITGRTRLLMFSKRQFLQLAEFEYQSNGQVFVLTGLFKAVADTDQLACILGHEMAHCLLAHGAEHASIIQLLDFVCLVFLTLIWATFPRDSLAALGQWIQKKLIEYMFDRPYSRKLEFEADEVGLRLAAKACIDVRASSVYWQQLELMKIVSGTFQIPEWFSTHPSNDHRVEHLEKLMPQAIKLREDCSCPSLPSVDPRLVFKLSMQEILKVSKKREEAICSDSETKHLSQCFEPSPAMIEKIPIVVPVQALQSTQSTHK